MYFETVDWATSKPSLRSSPWIAKLKFAIVDETNAMKNVIVVIGAGQIGQAVARPVAFGSHMSCAHYILSHSEVAPVNKQLIKQKTNGMDL
jgi:phosphoglycerate dehydrogenase-like enzyme